MLSTSLFSTICSLIINIQEWYLIYFGYYDLSDTDTIARLFVARGTKKYRFVTWTFWFYCLPKSKSLDFYTWDIRFGLLASQLEKFKLLWNSWNQSSPNLHVSKNISPWQLNKTFTRGNSRKWIADRTRSWLLAKCSQSKIHFCQLYKNILSISI